MQFTRLQNPVTRRSSVDEAALEEVQVARVSGHRIWLPPAWPRAPWRSSNDCLTASWSAPIPWTSARGFWRTSSTLADSWPPWSPTWTPAWRPPAAARSCPWLHLVLWPSMLLSSTSVPLWLAGRASHVPSLHMHGRLTPPLAPGSTLSRDGCRRRRWSATPRRYHSQSWVDFTPTQKPLGSVILHSGAWLPPKAWNPFTENVRSGRSTDSNHGRAIS